MKEHQTSALEKFLEGLALLIFTATPFLLALSSTSERQKNIFSHIEAKTTVPFARLVTENSMDTILNEYKAIAAQFHHIHSDFSHLQVDEKGQQIRQELDLELNDIDNQLSILKQDIDFLASKTATEIEAQNWQKDIRNQLRAVRRNLEQIRLEMTYLTRGPNTGPTT